ncbi:MAG: substrate-binding domain-containing protein [Limnobacter sp.]|uniref:substrate-binding domain-containing protein n=1 Tax=Limnobacter sp. TaxID=2003368 RepID=UPI00391C17A1
MTVLKQLRVRHRWSLGPQDNHDLLARTMRMLVEVHECGSLAKACELYGHAYRHAWGLLHAAEQLFGQPVIVMQRGRGTELTELGLRLVRAEQRVTARLEPILAEVTSELGRELDDLLHCQEDRVSVDASHCFAMDSVVNTLVNHDIAASIRWLDNTQVIDRLLKGQTDLAGFHLTGPGLNTLDTHWLERLAGGLWCDVRVLVQRELGLIVKTDNPLKLTTVRDVCQRHIRFVNTQPGSGSREVMNQLMAAQGLSDEALNEPFPAEHTHSAVAAFVASGMADAGFGVRAAASRFGLDFVHLATETYFMAWPKAMAERPGLVHAIGLLHDPAFLAQLSAIPGYLTGHTGQTLEQWLASEHQATP